MSEDSDGRLYDSGDVIDTDRGQFEVTAVTYQEDQNQNRFNFAYQFREKKDVDAEREAQAKHDAELKKAEEEAAAEKTE